MTRGNKDTLILILDTLILILINVALRPQRPHALLGTWSQDGHLDFHTAPELKVRVHGLLMPLFILTKL